MSQIKLFALVGDTDWGKSQTLYHIFEKSNFWPERSPITTSKFPGKRFTVINASNEDRITLEYLARLQRVIQKQYPSDTILFITISLILNDTDRSAIPVINFLNNLKEVDITYIVLEHSWFKECVLPGADLSQLSNMVSKGEIVRMTDLINESESAFEKRTSRIEEIIRERIL